jgi:hypothetical protein
MDLRRSLPVIGLMLLLVLDLVLVVWALWPSPRAASALPQVTVTASVPPSSSGRPSSGVTEGSKPDAYAPRPLTRLVVPVGKDAVWTADVGTCAEPGTIHVSDDRGETWSTHTAEGSVTRLRPDGASSAFVVGGDRRCQTRLWSTSDGGDSWNGPRSAAAAWGRSPKDPRLVHRPGGDPTAPCPGRSPVLDLVGLDGVNATALCGDGSLRRTSNAGENWRTSVTHEGAVALALSSPGAGVVASVDGECAGVVVGLLADAEVGGERCIKGLEPSPGEVAIGVSSGGVWLAADGRLLRAAEPGGAFERVSDWPTG